MSAAGLVEHGPAERPPLQQGLDRQRGRATPDTRNRSGACVRRSGSR